MTLENHMVSPSAAPDSQYDYLEPEREETCVSCGKTGYLVSDSWYEETIVDDDGEGAYLAGDGKALTGAVDWKYGWVCSERCQSQVMYEKAEPDARKALDAVLDASRTLLEYGEVARNLVNSLATDYIDESLVKEATKFIVMAEGAGDAPPWTERE